MYSLVRISGEPPPLASACRAPPPDSSSLMRTMPHASRMPRVPAFRRSSRMLLVQQLREPIQPGAWHHRGEVERARLAAG